VASIETQSKISLISKALILLGEKPCSSLTENRYGVTVGANLFELLYENELQATPWRFATKATALAQLNVTPVTDQYKYVFQKPTDCLLPSHAWPRQDYEIFGSHIYANQRTFNLVHLFKPDVSECPAYFNTLMTYALAKNMVNPITEGSAAKVQIQINLYNAQRALAQYADSQGRPPKPIQDNPFVDVRGGR
jgi:hypothetical protein